MGRRGAEEAARDVLDAAAELAAGLDVMSSEGQSNLVGQRLRTVAERVPRRVDRSVPAVPTH